MDENPSRRSPTGSSRAGGPIRLRSFCSNGGLGLMVNGTELRRCRRCGHERPLDKFESGPSGSVDLCSTCRGFDNAAANTFGLLRPEVVAIDGGWREARMLDGEFAGWLCRHTHVTPQAAEACQDKESILGAEIRVS